MPDPVGELFLRDLLEESMSRYAAWRRAYQADFPVPHYPSQQRIIDDVLGMPVFVDPRLLNSTREYDTPKPLTPQEQEAERLFPV